jgi:hypothetical protein
MLQAGFELVIPIFDLCKAIRISDRATVVTDKCIITLFICDYVISFFAWNIGLCNVKNLQLYLAHGCRASCDFKNISHSSDQTEIVNHKTNNNDNNNNLIFVRFRKSSWGPE